MLLTIDVGNTNIVLGVYKGYSLICDFRLNTIKNKTSDEYAMSITEILNANDIKKTEIEDVIGIPKIVKEISKALANTGINFWMIMAAGIGVIVAAFIMLFIVKKQKKRDE